MRAILHGGIPVREVEDDYIQEEILKGFDVQGCTNSAGAGCTGAVNVSGIMVKRDKEYYDFNPEIKNKEQIRELMGDASSEAIKQLEHWWDKYKVSLHDLDEQLADAESVMKGFLQELGYE